MSEKIEPALSAEEWAVALGQKSGAAVRVDTPYKRIALNNAALPDSDLRKITREWVQELREIAEDYEYSSSSAFESLHRFANALESYLPPEPT